MPELILIKEPPTELSYRGGVVKTKTGLQGSNNRTHSPACRVGWGQRIAAILILVVMVFGLNLHLFFAQLYGWSGMLADYRAETGSWSVAVQKTFDRETPCNVCLQVESAIHSGDRSGEPVLATVDGRYLTWILLLPVESTTAIQPPGSTWTPVRIPVAAHDSVASPPDSPPPRVHAV